MAETATAATAAAVAATATHAAAATPTGAEARTHESVLRAQPLYNAEPYHCKYAPLVANLSGQAGIDMEIDAAYQLEGPCHASNVANYHRLFPCEIGIAE